MKKANIIRSIFWGTIALIALVLGILGLLEYNKIFKNSKQDLENIIKIFNNSQIIKEYQNVDTEITASLKGKNIKIEYIGLETKTYNFKLKNGYLEVKINKNDTVGNVILMVITDSIAISKGQIEGNTYPLFKNNLIYNYKLTDGIEVNTSRSEYKVKISLNQYLTNTEDNFNDNLQNNITDKIENENDDIN